MWDNGNMESFVSNTVKVSGKVFSKGNFFLMWSPLAYSLADQSKPLIHTDCGHPEATPRCPLWTAHWNLAPFLRQWTDPTPTMPRGVHFLEFQTQLISKGLSTKLQTSGVPITMVSQFRETKLSRKSGYLLDSMVRLWRGSEDALALLSMYYVLTPYWFSRWALSEQGSILHSVDIWD